MGHSDHLGADASPGRPLHCDDRRDHAARPRVADRRTEEKVLAAHRAGLTRVIAPRDNRARPGRDPCQVRKQIAFTFVDHMIRCSTRR